jgi:hypothetical protein
MKDAFVDQILAADPKSERLQIPEALLSLFPQVSQVRCFKEKDLLKLVPVSRSKFLELCKQGKGPRALRCGSAKFYREVDVVEWLTGLYAG